MMTDKIEILSSLLLEIQGELVQEMQQVSGQLNIPLGWHYLLDLSWSAHMLQPFRSHNVMDAGAGWGVMQWWLASKGVNVLSVDLNNRDNLAPRFRAWCRVEGLRTGDLQSIARFPDLLPSKLTFNPPVWLNKLYGVLSKALTRQPLPPPSHGMVTIYNNDLADMPDIPDSSLDAVVSISALEHNEPEVLRGIVKELMRVIKPGGKLIATLGAAKNNDWFHEASKGWCYTEASLRDIFDLSYDCPSNYDKYNELFDALLKCTFLQDNLADFYFQSGNNGMPWGIWDPKYQPVGILKIKK